jgi:hypothetical protein
MKNVLLTLCFGVAFVALSYAANAEQQACANDNDCSWFDRCDQSTNKCYNPDYSAF